MTTTATIGAVVSKTESAIFVTNTVMHVLQRITHKRRLDPAYIQRSAEIIERGIRTWITEEKLRSVKLQVFTPGARTAIENWTIRFEYRTEPGSSTRRPPIEQVEEFAVRLRSLQPGATYQIYAEVDGDASRVDGWEPGDPLPIEAHTRQDFIGWGYGGIGAGLGYEGTDPAGDPGEEGDDPRRR